VNRSPLLLRLLVAAALFLTLSALCLRNYYPPLAYPLTVDLVLDRGTVGQSEPLVVSGRELSGDFLVVQYLDPTHVIFAYDSWGHPGRFSPKPITITPGTPLRLRIEMPALNQLRGHFSDPPGPIRVTCDGVTVLDITDHYFIREPTEIWLARNPLGGSACGPHLRGRLLALDGRELRGDPTQFFTYRERLAGWLTHSRHVFAVFLLCSAVAFGWLPLAWFHPNSLRARAQAARHALGHHRWFVGVTALSTVLFAGMITNSTFRFLQTEELATFYDYQMASLLDGHLDVPDDAIGGEAFVFAGKIYGYFGPTPALLRLPFALFGFAFGELSRSYMVAYFVAALVATYLIFLHARQRIGGSGNPSPIAVILLVGHVALGSTLFFFASRAYVFHEAILCGATFALFSCYFSLLHLAAGSAGAWRWALLCGVLSLHARPPTGLFALTFLGCVSVAHLIYHLRSRAVAALPRHLGIGALCILGVLTFNGLSYLKFKTFDGAPLRYSRPYGPERLAHIEGKSFHFANLPYGFYSYFIRPHFRVEPKFPWLYLGSTHPAPEFPDAKLDLPDHTLAIPWSMPGLFFLSTLGCAAAFFTHPAARGAIVVTWAAVLPMSVALCAAIATAQRYTGDWIPFLVGAAALGLAALETASPRLRLVLRALLFGCTLAAILLTFALTLHYQRETVWGVPEEFRQSYQNLRTRLTP
jgi:hypothetical protein